MDKFVHFQDNFTFRTISLSGHLFTHKHFQDTGDEFYLMEDKKLLCKADYDSAKAKGTQRVNMRKLLFSNKSF